MHLLVFEVHFLCNWLFFFLYLGVLSWSFFFHVCGSLWEGLLAGDNISLLLNNVLVIWSLVYSTLESVIFSNKLCDPGFLLV